MKGEGEIEQSFDAGWLLRCAWGGEETREERGGRRKSRGRMRSALPATRTCCSCSCSCSCLSVVTMVKWRRQRRMLATGPANKPSKWDLRVGSKKHCAGWCARACCFVCEWSVCVLVVLKCRGELCLVISSSHCLKQTPRSHHHNTHRERGKASEQAIPVAGAGVAADRMADQEKHIHYGSLEEKEKARLEVKCSMPSLPPSLPPSPHSPPSPQRPPSHASCRYGRADPML